jgi:hypothetical protein
MARISGSGVMHIGFQINHSMLFSYEVHCMPPEEFWEKFVAAANGASNELSAFVKPWNGRLPENEWKVIRQRIFARDDYTCRYCGERGKKLECDHVTPLSRGGSDEDDNLVTACRPCNRAKRDKTPGEWRGNGAN